MTKSVVAATTASVVQSRTPHCFGAKGSRFPRREPLSSREERCIVIERNNPAIDVDDLMSRIQQEVAKREVGFAPLVFDGETTDGHGFGSIDALINTAQAKSEVRTQWSARFQVFPFNRVAWLQRFFLKVLAYLFKDQRHVNFAVLQTLRELVMIERDLMRQMARLEADVKLLERRVESLEFRL